jgi:TP901 family phage tail tape measure protein
MADAGNIVVRVSANIDDFNRKMQLLSKEINEVQNKFSGFTNVGKQLTSVGRNMTLGVTLPITLAGGAAVKAASDFELMSNIFQSVTNATTDQMKQMQDVAIALGEDLTLPATSAVDAGEAMTELAKAGVSVDDTFKAAKGTLQLAAAAMMDNAEAGKIIGQTLNAFGLTGDEAVRIADLLANSANAAAGEISDMAYALQMGSAVASMAGVKVEDFVTAISLMANAGVVGSDAGTSLKSMFMRLIHPIGRGEDALHEYGLEVYDATGKMKPLPELIELFNEKLGKLTDEERNAALGAIFGTDAIRAANIVLMDGIDKWDGMYEAVTRSGGAADVAEAKMKGTSGAIQGLTSMLETLALTLGNILLPVITPVIRAITDLVKWFGDLPRGIQTTVIAVAGLAAAIGPLVLIGGKLLGGFVSVTKVLPLIAKGFSALLGPVGLTVAAIAGVTAAIAYLWKNNEGFRDFVIQAWDAISKAVRTAVDFIGGAIRKVTDFFGITRTTVADEVEAMSDETTAEIVRMSQGIESNLFLLQAQGKSISKEMADGIIAESKRMKEQAVKAINEQYQETVDKLGYLRDTAGMITNDQYTKMLEIETKRKNDQIANQEELNKQVEQKIRELQSSGVAVTEEMRQQIVQTVQAQRDGVIMAVSEQKDKAAAVIAMLKAESGQITAEMAAEAIKNSLTQKEETIKNANEQYQKTVEAIMAMSDEAIATTGYTRDELINNAKLQRDSTVEAATLMHEETVREIANMAGESIQNVNLSTGEMLSTWDKLKMGAASKFTEIKNTIVTAIGESKHNLSVLWGEIATTAASAWNGIKSTASTVWNGIKTAISDPIGSLKGILSSVWDSISTTASKAWNGLVGLASDMFGRVKDAILRPFRNLHIPLPHFTFSTREVSIAGIKFPIPDIDIDWYKTGGIFTQPSIIGVGESGPEAVLPLNDFVMGSIAEEIASKLANAGYTGGSFTITVPVYLDGREIARVTTPYVNEYLGKSYRSNARGGGVL